MNRAGAESARGAHPDVVTGLVRIGNNNLKLGRCCAGGLHAAAPGLRQLLRMLPHWDLLCQASSDMSSKAALCQTMPGLRCWLCRTCCEAPALSAASCGSQRNTIRPRNFTSVHCHSWQEECASARTAHPVLQHHTLVGRRRRVRCHEGCRRRHRLGAPCLPAQSTRDYSQN